MYKAIIVNKIYFFKVALWHTQWSYVHFFEASFRTP